MLTLAGMYSYSFYYFISDNIFIITSVLSKMLSNFILKNVCLTGQPQQFTTRYKQQILNIAAFATIFYKILYFIIFFPIGTGNGRASLGVKGDKGDVGNPGLPATAGIIKKNALFWEINYNPVHCICI